MGSSDDIQVLLRMITEMPADILGIEGYGIAQGSSADFVILDCESPEELFAMLPERRWIYRSGRWLRTVPPKPEWNGPDLSGHWEEAVRFASFPGNPILQI
jgi:cytosine deaminase